MVLINLANPNGSAIHGRKNIFLPNAGAFLFGR
jgi:hypothetical protein